MAWALTAATGGRIPSRGVRIDLSHPDVPPRIRAAVLWNLYERAEIGLIHRHLRPELDVIELGSSFGVTAAHALSVLGPERKLLAVEANESLLPALRRALADPRAEIVHGAVAYGAGEDVVEFHVHPTNHLHSRMNPRPDSVAVDVPRATLSGLVRDHAIGDFSLIADIEGAEAGLLAHGEGALDQCRCLIIELHATTFEGRRVEREELERSITALGFAKVDEERRTAVFTRS